MGFPRIVRAPLTILYRLMFLFVECAAGISLPYTIRLGRRVRIWHHSGIILHARAIGDDVQIRQNTTMGIASVDRPHDIPTIGDRVDIGCGACILGGITIGDDCKIGGECRGARRHPRRGDRRRDAGAGRPSRVLGAPIMIAVGVVAIGRNEGERLRQCLLSLADQGVPTVYVDSGSDDGSVALARSMGNEVVELDLSRPFSAARARNAGYERLRAIAPGLGAVMFLDGDCEVAAGWLDRAAEELVKRPDAAVVCGRRREKFPEQTIYNRLADLEWDTPIGEAITCGGDSVIRAEAFEAVGGFDPTAAAGEEPELCQRLRKKGWTVWRVDAEMTRHDLAMTRFRQWWRRQYRSGYNGLDILTRFPGDDQLFSQELKRARIWGIGWPVVVVMAGSAAGLAGGFLVGLAGAGLMVLTLPIQMARLAVKIRTRVDGVRTAIAYGVLAMVGKWANLAGQVGYWIDRRRGRMARLIEYKRVGEGQGAAATAEPSTAH